MNINKKSQIFVRIYYEDTDAGGIVYHANYLKFFERGRSEFLRQLDIHQNKLMDLNTAFVIKSLSINYKKGAKLDDYLMVETKLDKLRAASLFFTQQITDSNGVIYCVLDCKIACINFKTKQPQAIPQNVLLEFKNVC